MEFGYIDIPEPLHKACVEGRAAFFCGAGISMSAELPNFKNLVQQLEKHFSDCVKNTAGYKPSLEVRIQNLDNAAGKKSSRSGI